MASGLGGGGLSPTDRVGILAEADPIYAAEKGVALGAATLDAGGVNAQPPQAHAGTHQNGGGDEVSVAGLSGLLADGQTPLAHAADHLAGGADPIDAATAAARGTIELATQAEVDAGADAVRAVTPATLAATSLTLPPDLHAAAHQNGGGDEVSVAGLSGLLADGQTPLAHTHGNGDLTGVPGAAIDTTAIHSGDAAGGVLGGTYPNPRLNTFAATATGDITTASATDVLATTMTITPGAGTFLVFFSGSAEIDDNNESVEMSIYGNAVSVPASEVRSGPGLANQAMPFGTHALLTVGAGQAIEGRWRVSNVAATATMHERTLTALRVV